MKNIFSVVLLTLSLIFGGGIIWAQSYDVKDTAPPSCHTEREPMYGVYPWFEKYKLLVDLDCENGTLVVDVKIKDGSRPFKIEIKGSDTIFITLAPTASSSWGAKANLNSLIRIPSSFELFVAMDNDTAKYHAEHDPLANSLIVSTQQESWFIELETILKLPDSIIWIYKDSESMKRKTVKGLRDNLAEKGIQYTVLQKGYYICLGAIEIKGGINYSPILGRILFFKVNNEDISDSLLAVIQGYDNNLRVEIRPPKGAK